MAHQAHNIPWTLFASNFEYHFSEYRCGGVTNLYPCSRPNQGKELDYFVNAFRKTLEDHIEIEMQKYPRYAAPDPDDVILSDEIVNRISPTIHRLRRWLDEHRSEERLVDDVYVPNKDCRDHHDATKKCTCPLPRDERKMQAFLHPWQQNPCYHFWEHNAAQFLGLETVKTLLLYGEMDALLRICAHPKVGLEKLWSQAQCYDTGYTLGWDRVCEMALKSYLTLNVLHCFPRLWDYTSGRSAENDYRRTKAYQMTLRSVTQQVDMSNLASFPHRQFYGISDDQFIEYPTPRDEERWGAKSSTDFLQHYPYGILPIEQFLELENAVGYLPTGTDVADVRLVLEAKGLPTEIALMVMGFADYTCKRRLPIPHDPLHRGNSEELRKYLTYCWVLMVRCGVMAKALGSFINWHLLVMDCIGDLWSTMEDEADARDTRYRSKNGLFQYAVDTGDMPGINGYYGRVRKFA